MRRISTLPNDSSMRAPLPVVVSLPPVLLNLFPGAVGRVKVSAATIGEMIDALNDRWPGLRDCLCNSRPAIRRHINIFVEGERATLETRLRPGAEVFVLTAISGG